MAHRNVFMNLVRSFVTKSPELEAHSLTESGTNIDSASNGPLRFLGRMLEAGADLNVRESEQINRIEGGLATDEELSAICSGITPASSSAKALASAALFESMDED